MKTLRAVAIGFCVAFCGSGFTQQTDAPRADQSVLVQPEPEHVDSPAQQRIDAAKRQIEANPKKVQEYNELATAYLRRARETANPQYLQDADDAIAKGLGIDAADSQLQKTQVALMLSRHEYAQAKEKAAQLNKRNLDDVMVYGFLAEADIALGEYRDAETNTQWMMNMLPNNVPALMLGAKLRVLYGDPDGAIAFLNLAYTETSPTEVEELAWIANQMASIQIDSGRVDAAAATLDGAEKTFPRYPYTLENLARVKMAQRRAKDAVALLIEARKIDSNPHVLYLLAEAQTAAGLSTEARGTYTEFEKSANKRIGGYDDSVNDLVLMYAGSAAGAAKALAIAQQQIALRHDVFTLDSYSWALYANGRFQDADAAEQKAIAVGTQSTQIFDHAGHIARKLNRKDDAAKHFELAVRSNPASDFAADARAALGLSANSNDKRAMSSESPIKPADAPPEQSAAAALIETNQAEGATMSLDISSIASFAPVSSKLLTPRATETERLIHGAQAAATRDPEDAQTFAALGAAYFQRARETGDVGDYESAERALTKSLDLVSTDFSAGAALATMAEVYMGEHRFNDALTYAHKALSLGSGDVSPFAIVGDAYADMGEYDKARAAYARLTPRDMTFSPRAAYARDSRISYLDFISGNATEAIRLMKIAVAEGAQAQIPSENLAWLYYELGEYQVQAGDLTAADAAYVTALTIHRGDFRALASLAKLRANHGQYAEAIELYKKAIAVVPMPIFVAELGDLYAKVGDRAEANKQYRLVEYIGKLGQINQVLHNRDLALFYADHDMKLGESLELAQKEFEVRHDVYTWDALAWALYKNGDVAQAAKASSNALQYGTRDALLLFHAGMIANGMGQKDQARGELKQALEINPHFHLLYADDAQKALGLLDPNSASIESAVSHAR
jgi:tetratricopeptide (TPR) repeat protein